MPNLASGERKYPNVVSQCEHQATSWAFAIWGLRGEGMTVSCRNVRLTCARSQQSYGHRAVHSAVCSSNPRHGMSSEYWDTNSDSVGVADASDASSWRHSLAKSEDQCQESHVLLDPWSCRSGLAT